jgi:hypothetical protein
VEVRDPHATSLTDELGDVKRLEELEAEAIRFALAHYRGRMSEVSRRLGIGRSTLYRKLKELGSKMASRRRPLEAGCGFRALAHGASGPDKAKRGGDRRTSRMKSRLGAVLFLGWGISALSTAPARAEDTAPPRGAVLAGEPAALAPGDREHNVAVEHAVGAVTLSDQAGLPDPVITASIPDVRVPEPPLPPCRDLGTGRSAPPDRA